MKRNTLLASEALYGFAGWITTRDKEIVASAHHDSAIWAKLVDEFIKTNNLDKPRDRWEENLTLPKEPTYEWQWIITTNRDCFDITANYFTTKEEAQKNIGNFASIFEPYEPSKRKRK